MKGGGEAIAAERLAGRAQGSGAREIRGITGEILHLAVIHRQYAGGRDRKQALQKGQTPALPELERL